MIFKLALLNLFRHRARVVLSLLTVSGAIASTIIFRGYSHYVLEELRTYGAENQYGHIQIGHKKLWSPESEKIKDQLFEISESMLGKIKAMPEMVSAAPRLSLQGLVSNGESQFGAKVIGYDPGVETTIRGRLNVIEGDQLARTDDNGILLGSGLRKRVKAKLGDTVSVVTQTVDGVVNASDLTVKGIFQTTVSEVDDHVAFIPLKAAQTLLDTTNVEVWELRIRDMNQAAAVRSVLASAVNEVQPDLVVKSWRDLAHLYNQTEEFFNIQNLIVQLILSALTVLAILNTVGMTVYERTGEIGTMRALGQKRSEVVFQFMIEGFYLSVFGGVFGSLLACLASVLINVGGFATVLPGASVPIPIRTDLVGSAFVLAIGMGLLTTLLGTFVPAWRASRLPVVDALRKNI